MSEPIPPIPPIPPGAPPADERVAKVLAQLRAGVRQRQAEVAAAGTGTEEAQHKLLELKTREYVQEPLCVSPRPVLGRFLVFARKAMFHLFMKWFSRPVLEQQNLYNQTVSRLLQELLESEERSARRLAELEARLARYESRESRESPEREGP